MELVTSSEGPVVVKTARSPEGIASLRREADRLGRARHPGVVHLMSAEPGRLELAWVGSHTLETVRLSVPAAAGALAALAVTVADLHSMGIVHGRIDPSHVVIAADGRPVLCGMRGNEPGTIEPGPAEDVAAVGRLIDHLLGAHAEPEPIPDRRWGRRAWSGYNRRTLQLLADRATHEDPARRPTARALANAIMDAVPDARLIPDNSPLDSPPAATAKETTDNHKVSLDAGAEAETKTKTETTTNTSIGPAIETPIEPNTETEVDPQDNDEAGPGQSSGPDPLRAGPFLDRPTIPQPETSPARPPRQPERSLQPAERESTILGLRLESTDSNPVNEAGRLREIPPSEPTSPTDTATGATPPTPPGISRDRWGSWPPRERSVAVVAGAALVLVAMVGGGMVRSSVGGASSAPPSPSRPAGATSSPERSDRASDTRSTTEPEPELDSTENLEGSNSAIVVESEGARYRVGRPGDVVTVGDWDCDGVSTPGVVRPSTGEVFLFPTWAAPDEPLTLTASLRVAGAQGLASSDQGCHPLVLTSTGQALAITATSTGWTVEASS